MANVISFWVSIENKLRAFLVDGIVSQMHHHVIKVSRPRFLIFLGSKTSQALSCYVSTQRINSCDQYIYTEIELKARYQVRFVKVSLCHKVFISILHPIEAPSEEYALALAACLGLHNESFRLFIIELYLEIFGILGQYPGRREKIVVVRTLPLHRLQVTSQ